MPVILGETVMAMTLDSWNQAASSSLLPRVAVASAESQSGATRCRRILKLSAHHRKPLSSQPSVSDVQNIKA
eukprot:6014136-Amphidinium_carterae.1